MEISLLESKFYNQNSYYGKAQTVREDTGEITLFSYETEMAKIRDGVLYLISHRGGDYSRTTMRHLNDFVYQYSQIGKLRLADVEKALDNDMTIRAKE